MNSEKIAFAGNAILGSFGQGEMIRQMAYALEAYSDAVVFCRSGQMDKVAVRNIPFRRSAERLLFDGVQNIPGLRSHRNWLALLSDIEFDRKVSGKLEDFALYDGVVGQCCETFQKIRTRKPSAKLVLSSFNTHIDYLLQTLEEEHRNLKMREPHFIHPLMRRRVLREMEIADVIRVNSNWAKQTFVEQGVPEKKIYAIHPAVDTGRFYPVAKKDKTFRVLAVSTVEPRKGIYYLLQAFEEAKIADSELVIIGGTGDRTSKKMMEQFCRRNSNIRVQPVNVMKVPVEETYGAASVLVHPALEDGYGLVIAQALASGRPVIATRQSGASELIRDGKSGFVLERRDVASLKDRLRLLASDSRLAAQMGQEAAHDAAPLTYENFAKEVRNFYSEVLNAVTK